MSDYVKRMIEEHSQLVIRICKLNDYVYSEKSDKDDKVEFANKCIQLAAMKKYEEALRARLINAGIRFENGEYVTTLAKVTKINEVVEYENNQLNTPKPCDHQEGQNPDNLVLE